MQVVNEQTQKELRLNIFLCDTIDCDTVRKYKASIYLFFPSS